ncbi:MAG: hypothetical protein M0Q02_08905, partial [Candidatus Muirbacterium halophilum]|nr:hypothetical protein [Candidatus Muirbacterium halophilum]
GIVSVSKLGFTRKIYFLKDNTTYYDILMVEDNNNTITHVELGKFSILNNFSLYTNLTAELLNNKSFLISGAGYINFYNDNTLYNSMDKLEGTWSLEDYAGKKIIKTQYATKYEFVFVHADSVFTNGQTVIVSVLANYENNLFDGDTQRISTTYGDIISDFAGGSGTESNPYQVATAEQLNKVRNHLDKHFIQTADIDLSTYAAGEGWMPIASSVASAFSGVYDGDGFTISNLTINRPTTDGQSLFGYLNGISLTNKAQIKNLTVDIANITGKDYTAILGSEVRRSIITNCSTFGQVIGENIVGGFIGQIADGTSVTFCNSLAIISGQNNIGGLIGYNANNTTEWEDLLLSCSYAAGNVTGITNVGGLVGTNADGIISNCYATGDVHALTGGSTPVNESSVKVGGLAGYNFTAGKITNSYSTGNITTAHVNNLVFGFAGYNNTTVGAEVSGCFWDTTASGQTNGIYSLEQSSSVGATGKTTLQMQTATTFTGWDTAIWSLVDGSYPTLK